MLSNQILNFVVANGLSVKILLRHLNKIQKNNLVSFVKKQINIIATEKARNNKLFLKNSFAPLINIGDTELVSQNDDVQIIGNIYNKIIKTQKKQKIEKTKKNENFEKNKKNEKVEKNIKKLIKTYGTNCHEDYYIIPSDNGAVRIKKCLRASQDGIDKDTFIEYSIKTWKSGKSNVLSKNYSKRFLIDLLKRTRDNNKKMNFIKNTPYYYINKEKDDFNEFKMRLELEMLCMKERSNNLPKVSYRGGAVIPDNKEEFSKAEPSVSSNPVLIPEAEHEKQILGSQPLDKTETNFTSSDKTIKFDSFNKIDETYQLDIKKIFSWNLADVKNKNKSKLLHTSIIELDNSEDVKSKIQNMYTIITELCPESVKWTSLFKGILKEDGFKDKYEILVDWGYVADKNLITTEHPVITDKYIVPGWCGMLTDYKVVYSKSMGFNFDNNALRALFGFVKSNYSIDFSIPESFSRRLTREDYHVHTQFFNKFSRLRSYGDNHLFLLVKWVLKYFAVKQIEEWGSTVKSELSIKEFEKLFLILPENAHGKGPIALTMDHLVRNLNTAPILTHFAPDKDDLLHYAFLTKDFDNNFGVKLHEGGEYIRPVWANYKFSSGYNFKIIVNDLDEMNKLLTKVELSTEEPKTITSETLIKIINSYCITHNINDQLVLAYSVAQLMLLNPEDNIFEFLPTPIHLADHRLWLEGGYNDYNVNNVIPYTVNVSQLIAYCSIFNNVLQEVINDEIALCLQANKRTVKTHLIVDLIHQHLEGLCPHGFGSIVGYLLEKMTNVVIPKLTLDNTFSMRRYYSGCRGNKYMTENIKPSALLLVNKEKMSNAYKYILSLGDLPKQVEFSSCTPLIKMIEQWWNKHKYMEYDEIDINKFEIVKIQDKTEEYPFSFKSLHPRRRYEMLELYKSKILWFRTKEINRPDMKIMNETDIEDFSLDDYLFGSKYLPKTGPVPNERRLDDISTSTTENTNRIPQFEKDVETKNEELQEVSKHVELKKRHNTIPSGDLSSEGTEDIEANSGKKLNIDQIMRQSDYSKNNYFGTCKVKREFWNTIMEKSETHVAIGNGNCGPDAVINNIAFLLQETYSFEHLEGKKGNITIKNYVDYVKNIDILREGYNNHTFHSIGPVLFKYDIPDRYWYTEEGLAAICNYYDMNLIIYSENGSTNDELNYGLHFYVPYKNIGFDFESTSKDNYDNLGKYFLDDDKVIIKKKTVILRHRNEHFDCKLINYEKEGMHYLSNLKLILKACKANEIKVYDLVDSPHITEGNSYKSGESLVSLISEIKLANLNLKDLTEKLNYKSFTLLDWNNYLNKQIDENRLICNDREVYYDLIKLRDVLNNIVESEDKDSYLTFSKNIKNSKICSDTGGLKLDYLVSYYNDIKINIGNLLPEHYCDFIKNVNNINKAKEISNYYPRGKDANIKKSNILFFQLLELCKYLNTTIVKDYYREIRRYLISNVGAKNGFITTWFMYIILNTLDKSSFELLIDNGYFSIGYNHWQKHFSNFNTEVRLLFANKKVNIPNKDFAQMLYLNNFVGKPHSCGTIWESEKHNRTSGHSGYKMFDIDVHKYMDVSDIELDNIVRVTIEEHCHLNTTPKDQLSFEEYLNNRYEWLVGGSTSESINKNQLKTMFKIDELNDEENELINENLKLDKRAFLNTLNTSELLSILGDGPKVHLAKGHIKGNDNGKERAIYASSLSHYLVGCYLSNIVETNLKIENSILNKDDVEKDRIYQQISNNITQGKSCLCFDYTDFNVQHSLKLQQFIIKNLVKKYVNENIQVNNDYVRLSKNYENSFLEQYYLDPSTDKWVKCERGLFSGCRHTSLINTIAHLVYNRMIINSLNNHEYIFKTNNVKYIR